MSTLCELLKCKLGSAFGVCCPFPMFLAGLGAGLMHGAMVEHGTGTVSQNCFEGLHGSRRRSNIDEARAVREEAEDPVDMASLRLADNLIDCAGLIDGIQAVPSTIVLSPDIESRCSGTRSRACKANPDTRISSRSRRRLVFQLALCSAHGHCSRLACPPFLRAGCAGDLLKH